MKNRKGEAIISLTSVLPNQKFLITSHANIATPISCDATYI
ncbi:MAG: hypothetical protein Q4C42_10385 [Clostridia bacterium]|nr:hypothetical protein [Clostridia bacterium]